MALFFVVLCGYSIKTTCIHPQEHNLFGILQCETRLEYLATTLRVPTRVEFIEGEKLRNFSSRQGRGGVVPRRGRYLFKSPREPLLTSIYGVEFLFILPHLFTLHAPQGGHLPDKRTTMTARFVELFVFCLFNQKKKKRWKKKTRKECYQVTGSLLQNTPPVTYTKNRLWSPYDFVFFFSLICDKSITVLSHHLSSKALQWPVASYNPPVVHEKISKWIGNFTQVSLRALIHDGWIRHRNYI